MKYPNKFKQYIWNILIAFDQFCNAMLLGDPGETMSSRMGKHLAKHDCPFCGFLCSLLNLIQKDHCVRSIELDEGKDSVFFND
jgi:hypothetical protein